MSKSYSEICLNCKHSYYRGVDLTCDLTHRPVELEMVCGFWKPEDFLFDEEAEDGQG